MAVILEEEGAETVTDVIYGGGPVSLPFIALMEVEYKLFQRNPLVVDNALALIDSWPVQPVESFYSWRREAARIKATARVSSADAWVASLALLMDAELVHKGLEFESINGLKVLQLPYGPRRSRP
jgi:predicted nucleic acid-binding protein